MGFLYNVGNIQRYAAVHPTVIGVANPTIVWDEKTEGYISKQLLGQMGGLVKQGQALEFSQARLDQHVAAIAAQVTSEAQREARIQQAKAFLAGLDTSSTLTAAQLTNAVKAIIVLFKDLYRQV